MSTLLHNLSLDLLRYNPIIMLAKVQEILIRECRLVSDKPILIGVSGGPDSLSLLDVLHRSGYLIIIAHLNHKLRPESTLEASHLAQIAVQMGVPIIQSEADVPEFARQHSLSTEEAARELRYDFLFDIAKTENVQAVAVGHNADDQVETVLMHLLRGAGLAGLKGMSYRSLPNAWSDQIPLIRPFLGTWRKEILQYCHDRMLIPEYDQSNLDRSYFRNRLRYDLIPYLESYNPRIKEIVYKTAGILREDFEILLPAIDIAWKECLFLEGSDYSALRIDRLQRFPLGMQRHIIRMAIAHHCPDLRDIDFETVEHVISFIVEPTRTFQRDLVSGLRLYIEVDLLWIAKWGAILPESGWPSVPADHPLILQIPGTVILGNGWELSGEIQLATEALSERISNNNNPYQAWLDAGDISTTIQIRSRLPGDRFKPHGMDGHSIKLSDFMINVKMQSRAREKWPLICSQNTIIWIPGYRIHQAYQVSSSTKSLLYLRLIHQV
jgi:tRNA(Ile)-lysidine synthase